MPEPADLTGGLNPYPQQGALSKGYVTGLYATSDPYNQGFGGVILVDDNAFSCPTACTAAMLTVAADARRIGTPVWVHATGQAILIDITSGDRPL